MADLSVNYMGIRLKNPIILGASNFSNDINLIKQAEEAGISALVYKTLFEEQIQLESLQLEEELREYDFRAAEMDTIFPEIEHAGPREHLYNIKKLKESVSIPVIGSINALYNPTWIEYAQLLEKTGIDGLELNLYRIPVSHDADSKTIESHQLKIINEIKDVVKIPVSVKLNYFYTNPLNFSERLDKLNVNGIVLFNRFFQPDIDIENEEFNFSWELTCMGEYKVTLRYVGLLYNTVKSSIIANRGIKTSEDVIKMLLAGADAIQMVSAFYDNGFEFATKILKDIEQWMNKKGYASINDFRGKLSRANMKDDSAYNREQYIDILKNSEEIFKKYPQR